MFRRCHWGAALFVLVGCSFDWDTFDPRLGTAVGATSSSSSSGGSTTSGPGGSGSGGSAFGGAGGMELGPFGTPQLVMELSSTSDDDDPFVSDDGLELFFNSTRAPSQAAAIWQSVRMSTSDPWGMPTYVLELDSATVETNPLVSHDGMTMWLSSDRDAPAVNVDIYVSTRMSRTSGWSTPVLVQELSTPTATEYARGVSADELTLIIQANSKIHISTRNSKSEPWSAKMVIAELDTGAAEGGGWLAADALHLAYESNKDGADRDLYLGERLSAADPFEPIVHLMELDLGDDETDASLTNDLRYIVFAVGQSNRDIYESRR
jgi:WD40 repeat protein